MRVVAGELRSRRLHAVAGRETRPTSDRARAGLFDWLGPHCVDGARVLDLFAGTGALGIEALSRGASEAVFVERARPALRALRRNLDELGLDERARVVEADLERGLAPLGPKLGRFDLVLADPPWQSKAREALYRDGALARALEPEGVLVIERSARDEAPAAAPGLRLCGSKRYGETAFDWWEGEAGPAAVASEALD